MKDIIIGILMKHGENDYSLWRPEIPANDPLLIALLDKYGNSGGAVRGTGEDLHDELLPLINESQQNVHMTVYNDKGNSYVGCDVFTTFEAALGQFDERVQATMDEHPDEPNWFNELIRDAEQHQLYFCCKDGYEVFYRCEKLQRNAQPQTKCWFCAQPFHADQEGHEIHRCSTCGKLFCNDCYKAMTGNPYDKKGTDGTICCPTCVLELSICLCLSEWLGDYANRMPESFFKDVYNDVYHSSGFNCAEGFNNDDIRLSFARVIARHFDVEC